MPCDHSRSKRRLSPAKRELMAELFEDSDDDWRSHHFECGECDFTGTPGDLVSHYLSGRCPSTGRTFADVETFDGYARAEWVSTNPRTYISYVQEARGNLPAVVVRVYFTDADKIIVAAKAMCFDHVSDMKTSYTLTLLDKHNSGQRVSYMGFADGWMSHDWDWILASEFASVVFPRSSFKYMDRWTLSVEVERDIQWTQRN
jgi:hypothetical protein